MRAFDNQAFAGVLSLDKYSSYRRVFVEHNGPPPWACDWCGEQVDDISRGGPLDGNVHHKDEDRSNNDPENLGIMHAACHTKHHGPPTEEQKQRIKAKLLGRPSPTRGMRFSPEVNDKKSRPGVLNPYYGQQHPEEIRQKMRQPRRRIECLDCGRSYAVNWINRHKIEDRCVS